MELNSQYPGYKWQHQVGIELACHIVLGSTYRFLPHTVKSLHSSFHTNNMTGNHCDERYQLMKVPQLRKIVLTVKGRSELLELADQAVNMMMVLRYMTTKARQTI